MYNPKKITNIPPILDNQIRYFTNTEPAKPKSEPKSTKIIVKPITYSKPFITILLLIF